jgi:4'-phosphopantetheinyl transferase
MPARRRHDIAQSMTDGFPEIIRFSASPPPLVANQLHLMVTSVDELAENLERTAAVIDSEERARADRFINTAHGDNYRLVRGTLRLCLAEYTGMPAEAIRFIANQYGKPEIAPEQNQQALQFNISHSHRMTAFLFSLRKSVGVDIEFIKPLKNMSGLAQHVCSPEELEEFNTLEKAQQQDSFFRLWTRKEAFIKAKGQGLSMGLRSIHIGFDTSNSTHLIQYKGDRLDNWLVKDLACDANYKLAAAIET